ncbi:MAG: thioredoxin family protein [Holophagales bacterium]|nr:thioredoxin family protein [Holophagales bacterium]
MIRPRNATTVPSSPPFSVGGLRSLALSAGVALVLTLNPSQPAAAAPEGWLTSLEQAMAQAQERDAEILVDLYAAWCGWCKVLEEEVFNSEEFRAYAKEKGFVLLHVDTEDGGEGTELQARYNATSLPTTLILDSDMVQVGAIRGYAPTAELIDRIDAQISAWGVILANYVRVLESSDADLQRRMAEDMHERGSGERAAALYERVLEQVEPGTEAAAWLHYLAADSHRLAASFDRAREQLGRSRKMVKVLDGGGSEQLAERVDLLDFLIAQEGGTCKQAVIALDSFLEAHPRSRMRRELEQTRNRLQRDEACT